MQIASLSPLLCLALTTACYETPLPECAFSCGPSADCPDGYTCRTDGWCKRDDVPDEALCGPAVADAAPNIDGSTGGSDGAPDGSADASIDAGQDGAPDAAEPDAAVDAAAPDADVPDAARAADAAVPDASPVDAMSFSPPYALEPLTGS